MKKVYLFFLISIFSLKSNSQVFLNEVGNLSNGSNFHFIELYNQSNNSENLDCYSLVIYKDPTTNSLGTDYGMYLINFKSTSSIAAGGYLSINHNNITTVANVYYYAYSSGNTYATPTPIISFSNGQLLNNSNNATNEVILLKNSTVQDLFAGKLNANEASLLANSFATPLNILAPCSGGINFGLSFNQVSSQFSSRSVAQPSGSNSFTRSCNGSCYSWITANSTSGSANSCTNAVDYGTPSWNVSSITYKLNSTQTNNCFSSNYSSIPGITNGAIAYSYDAQNVGTAKITVSINSFSSNIIGADIQVQVIEDNTTPQNLSQNDNVFSTTSITIPSLTIPLSTATNGTISFDLNLPVPQSGQQYPIMIVISTKPGQCYFTSPTYFANTYFGALPVELKSLNVKNKGIGNEIIWSTSSEQNNKGFEIQRSIGSTNNFKTIGFVGTKAKQGNSQTEISYSFEDADIKAGEMHYYRLNQIDFDGKSALSPVKSIKPGSIASGMNVYPNPSRGSVTVNTGSNAKMNMMLIDNTGRMVQQYNNVSGSNTQINNLKKGFYTLKIVDPLTGEQSAQRIVVQ